MPRMTKDPLPLEGLGARISPRQVYPLPVGLALPTCIFLRKGEGQMGAKLSSGGEYGGTGQPSVFFGPALAIVPLGDEEFYFALEDNSL